MASQFVEPRNCFARRPGVRYNPSIPEMRPTLVDRLDEVAASHPSRVVAAGLLGVAVIGSVDYFTGFEIRVYPLYFLPLSLIAWYGGRRLTLGCATVCACSWLGSNYLAGLRYSHLAVWPFNFVMQGISFVVVGQLIATLRLALEREERLGRTDPLTALLNRRAFFPAARQVLALARRYNRPVTIAYIDLDNFKAMNDTFGHEHGDAALQQAADLIRQGVRMGDLVARFGGDEFVALLPETDAVGAKALLERLRAVLADSFRQSAYPMSVSIGAISFATAPAEVEELVCQADKAMYEAKSRGKNRLNLLVFGPGVTLTAGTIGTT